MAGLYDELPSVRLSGFCAGTARSGGECPTMRRRLFAGLLAALVLGGLAAPAVLAGNDYSNQA
jgi:hypothetical protein